jgi:hypothetical protein
MNRLAVLLLSCAACTDDTQPTPDGPGSFVAVASDFATGSYGRFDPTAPSYAEIGAADADPQVRVRAGRVFVLGRDGSNVTELDPGDLSVAGQVSVADEGGGTANPHDLCLSGSKAYVLRYDLATVGVYESSSWAPVGTIDLSDLADDDGIPEMESCAVSETADGPRLWVTVERLDRAAYFGCAGESFLVEIDPATDSVVGQHTLAACNPFAEVREDGDRLLVAETGAFGVADGGIEAISLSTGEPAGFVVTEEALGGDVGAFAACGDQAAAIVSDADFNTLLVAFDPADGAVGGTLYAPDGYALTDVECAGDRLVVTNVTVDGPGLVLVDWTGETPPTEPIDTGLPPVDVSALP